MTEKKEYAKIAITLTVSKGQALRVFEKKSPHLRCASGSIFFRRPCKPRRHTPPLRSNSFRYASLGAHGGRVGLFFLSGVHSLVIRGYSCPPNPNKVFVLLIKYSIGGQPPLSVVLACGSLGLIRLSRFLHCSVSFFLPQPFLAVVVVFLSVVPQAALLAVTPPRIFYPSKRKSFFHCISLRCISFIHSCPCPTRKKNYTTQQKFAPALP